MTFSTKSELVDWRICRQRIFIYDMERCSFFVIYRVYSVAWVCIISRQRGVCAECGQCSGGWILLEDFEEGVTRRRSLLQSGPFSYATFLTGTSIFVSLGRGRSIKPRRGTDFNSGVSATARSLDRTPWSTDAGPNRCSPEICVARPLATHPIG